jgi:hypothetical protein
MEMTKHYMHANDDAFLRVLGVDPDIHPQRYTWSQFCEEKGVRPEDLIDDVVLKSGFFQTVRLRDLKERLTLYGYDVIADFYENEDNGTDGPRVVILSGGPVLKEKQRRGGSYLRNSTESERNYYFDVDQLVGKLHLGFWCDDCLKSFDVKTDVPAYNGTECAYCKSTRTKLIAVDEVK